MFWLNDDNDDCGSGDNDGGRGWLLDDDNDDDHNDDENSLTLHRVARCQGRGGVVAPGPSPGMAGICERCPPPLFVYLLLVYDCHKVELKN